MGSATRSFVSLPLRETGEVHMIVPSFGYDSTIKRRESENNFVQQLKQCHLKALFKACI